MKRLRWVVTLCALGLLLAGLYAILTPFFEPMLWALVFVLSTWPIYKRLVRQLHRFPVFASALMTALLAGVIVLAIAPLFATLGSEFQRATSHIEEFLAQDPAEIHSAVQSIPYLGEQLDSSIQTLLSERHELLNFVGSHRQNIFELATGAAKGVFAVVFKVFMCLFTVFFFYLHGESVAAQINRAAFRLGGERFLSLLVAIRATVKAVVYGMLATALAQGILAGVGYVFAGAPVPILLGFLTMVFSLIPFGTPFVYLPVAAIVVANGAPWFYGVLLAVWGIVVVSGVDNILRPLLISQATKMPVLLVFLAVVGGVVGFGFMGLFIGPVLIAIAQVLWLELVDGTVSNEGLKAVTSQEQ